MTGEGFCEKHGPYDAAAGKCPYCARERGLPPEPPPLDDDLPTDPWGGRPRPVRAARDPDETGARERERFYEEADEEATDWPKRRTGKWDEDEDVTDWPKRRRPGIDDDDTVVEHAEAGLLGFLVVKEGMRRGQVHRIKHGSTIGRSGADILVRDPKVSRSHAKFTVEDDCFFVWDFGSENGTFVNGNRIREATPLAENDVIKIGDTLFVLKTLN